MSGDAARVQSKMDRVAGQAFLSARQFLKGQGQIIDFESRRAEAAMARLNAAQSYEDYRDALTELQDAVRVGMMKVQMTAGQGGASPAPAASAPSGIDPSIWDAMTPEERALFQ